jgi:hypothetical protein
MQLLRTLIGSVMERAHAGNIDQTGQGSPGIDEMWERIRMLFPHTDVGGNGLGFLLLRITDIILKSIGGIAVAMIIYGGIKIISGGDEGLGEGKKVVTYAVAGLICAMVADAVVIYTSVLISGVSS